MTSFLFIIVFTLQALQAYGSTGDRSDVFQSCLKQCIFHICLDPVHMQAFQIRQPFHLWILQWSCENECQYSCMWRTVNVFVDSGGPVPQFYGKWPFVRWLGLQEPASVVFSIMNGLSFYAVWRKFRRKVPGRAPLYHIWNGYALVSLNAWFWSAIFHARDNKLTEMLDYFCATSGVLYSFFCLIVRLIGTQNQNRVAGFGMVCFIFYISHIYYLAFVQFDYGYNMKASIAIGFINSLGWLLWCVTRWRTQPYVWQCVTVVLSVNALLLLELEDFPPLLWTFDAHSLWHLGTVPLPLIWFSVLVFCV